MDTNNKYTYPRAIILAACSLLLAGACDNYDGSGSDTPGREVRLNFNASIENTEGAQSRSITGITDFSGIPMLSECPSLKVRTGVRFSKDRQT